MHQMAASSTTDAIAALKRVEQLFSQPSGSLQDLETFLVNLDVIRNGSAAQIVSRHIRIFSIHMM